MAECFELPCGSNGALRLMASVREDAALERSLQCLRLSSKSGDISSSELADKLNTSNGAAYYGLNALLPKSFLKAENLKVVQKNQVIFIF